MRLRALGQVLIAATLIGANLTACGPTKSAQCQLLSSEINQVSGLGKKFEAVGKDLESKRGKVKGLAGFHAISKEGAEKVSGLVKELDGFIGNVKAVELKDETLVGYRNKAVTIYSGASKSLKDVGDVLSSFTTLQANEDGKKLIEGSQKKLATAMKDLQTVDKEEQAVAKEFNEYCGLTTK